MRTMIKKLVPAPLRPALESAWWKLQHRYITVKLFGRDAGFVPPLSLMYDGPVGYQEFKENGAEFLKYYIEVCDLRPDEAVLDIGSGTGRKTLPLLGYLSERGSYLGMEIVKSGVEWCREKYAAVPNFKFQEIDVYNQLYNPQGTYQAAEYKLPLPDVQFDFVVLNSVFTHMMPAEVENYLSEISRVLKKGGRCLISFFLLNAEAEKLIESGVSSKDLKYKFGPARALSEAEPELAIGYDEDFVVKLYRELGLEIQQPIRYGSWCGRKNYLSYQDLVVGIKTR
jgi:SAM-dependent methyltransferase